jgi:hypothetical protein
MKSASSLSYCVATSLSCFSWEEAFDDIAVLVQFGVIGTLNVGFAWAE